MKTCESMSIEVMRLLQLAAHREHVQRIEITVADDVADYLLNKKRKRDRRAGGERQHPGADHAAVPGAPPETLEFVCYDNNNNEVKLFPEPAVPTGCSRR